MPCTRVNHCWSSLVARALMKGHIGVFIEILKMRTDPNAGLSHPLYKEVGPLARSVKGEIRAMKAGDAILLLLGGSGRCGHLNRSRGAALDLGDGSQFLLC